MIIIERVDQLRETLRRYRSPAFAPTMGNLHEGHLSLIARAKSLGDICVASIFVNRLQFAPGEDFERYPRTFERDVALLEEAGCDILFAPTEQQLYPQPQTFKVLPDPGLADILEGEYRPGFFIGVATVVMKLFQCVFGQSSGTGHALFGEKDYQQLLVIRQMVRQFALPVQVHAMPTVRDADGLAKSSRNGYLSAEQRRDAVALSSALAQVAAAVQAGESELERLSQQAMQQLRELGWQPDYLSVRRQADLLEPASCDDALVVLGAARLGSTRLIDNILFTR